MISFTLRPMGRKKNKRILEYLYYSKHNELNKCHVDIKNVCFLQKYYKYFAHRLAQNFSNTLQSIRRIV